MKLLVHTLSRPLLGAAAALTLGLSALAPAAASADSGPAVQTSPASAVTDTSAILNGVVGPQRDLTVYTFQYGIKSYDHATPITRLPASGNGPRPVSVPVTGLTPATLYHFRLVAGDGRIFGWTAGNDQTFTTAPAPTPLPPAGGAVPTGAVVDTRGGEVALTTALPGGKTQTARFHGGVFRVRQSAAGGGITDIDLRGPALQCARPKGTARASAAAATKRKPRRRKLWGSDKGGRFRTHGANSVATVRGTRWVTTDTCAGTRTTVTNGAVSVRDVHRKRTVLVRAGHSYLARSR
jgi:hypothetical protein